MFSVIYDILIFRITYLTIVLIPLLKNYNNMIKIIGIKVFYDSKYFKTVLM